ncbi:MAG: hypothetical protein ABI461_17895, partial [Polyangiaceae bacterium]
SSASAAASTTDRPLTSSERLIFAGVLALALFVLFRGRAAGMVPTSVWDHDSGIFGARFAAQLGVLFVGVIGLQLFPERWSRVILMIEGAVCLAIMGHSTALLFGALLLAWFFALALPLPAIARLVMCAALLAILGWCGGHGLIARAYAFSMMFSLRLIMYAWDQWQKGFPKAALRPYLTYVLAAPLVVFPPYLTFIPTFDKHDAKITPRLSASRVRRAFRHFGLGLLFAFFVAFAHVAPNIDGTSLPIRSLRYVMVVASVAQIAHLTFALLLLHGMDDRLPINNPLFSRDYVQYWSRFQIHQKDMQVNLFYTPALFRLRKGNRYITIMAALMWTLVLWNTILHLLIRYLYFTHAELLEHLRIALMVNALNTLVIGGTLCLQEWRRRSKHPAPKGLVWEGMSWMCTMLFAVTTTT